MNELERRNFNFDIRASDYEYEKCGMKAPYDIDAVHKERQTKRDRINELQVMLAKGGDAK